LEAAALSLSAKAIAPYFQLREMFGQGNSEQFRTLFGKFYGIRFAGDAWKLTYFELLFDFDNLNLGPNPYQQLLERLWPHPRINGVQTLEFSFVSKLVAFRDERAPLYDRNVQRYFGMGPPASGSHAFRSAGFVRNLEHVREIYFDWLSDFAMTDILNRLRERLPLLASCHPIRICDFLVWTAGR